VDYVNKIIQGDVLDVLRQLPAGIIQTMITSPPYWGLRDYGTADWQGGDEKCDHKKNVAFSDKALAKSTIGKAANTGHAQEPFKERCSKCGAIRIDSQLGLEKSPEIYVEKMVAIFREVWRVLRDDGTVWLNLGDSYNGGGSGRDKDPKYKQYMSFTLTTNVGSTTMPRVNIDDTLKPKDLCGIPWRVALALQSDGWYLRSDIIWAKGNPMPESCTDRPTKSHEYLFLLTKSAKYYYDNEAIREEGAGRLDRGHEVRGRIGKQGWKGESLDESSGRNRRSVWTLPTQSFDGEYCTNCNGYFTGSSKNLIGIVKVIENGEEITKRICPTCQSTECWVAHFATFPEALVEPCIMAGTSERGACPECGKCWVRVVEREKGNSIESCQAYQGDANPNRGAEIYRPTISSKTIGWRPSCNCNAGEPVPSLVGDIFMGSGTVALVALRANRRFTGIELSQDYIDMSYKRLEPLLNQEVMKL